MSDLKYKTKPITIVESIEEIWNALIELDATNKSLMQDIRNLQKRVKELERNDSRPDAETKRLR